MAPAKHTTEQRAFIVWAIANCYSPDAIVGKFKSEFRGVECTINDVAACDPRRLEGDWRRYFDQERAAFYEAPNNKQFRMALLRRMLVENESRNVPAVALKAAELLAKEEAGFYTPKTPKAVDEKDDGPATFTFGLDRAEQD